MKKALVVLAVLVLIVVNLYAAGDLIVDGNLGVGTTTPTAKADIAGTFKLGTSGSVSSGILHGAITVNPPSIGAGGSNSAIAATIPGAAVGDSVFLTPPNNIEGNLFYQGATITAANTVTIRIGNESTAAVDGAARTWSYLLIKP